MGQGEPVCIEAAWEPASDVQLNEKPSTVMHRCYGRTWPLPEVHSVQDASAQPQSESAAIF